MSKVLAAGCAALLAVAGSSLAAQGNSAGKSGSDYPARPIRLIVPFPPGGSNDILARYFSLYLSERLGRQVVVDNRAGADGIIGTEVAAHAQPDGYTLYFSSAAYAVNAATRKLTYDPLKAFSWVGTLGFGPSVLSVGPALKINTAKELIAHGRANPGKLTMTSSGGYAYMAAELFNQMSGMKMVVVVYKGGFPALLDVMGGQAHVNLGSLIQTLPHLSSGRVKALATSGSKRAAATPELPTIAESGVAGYEANNWWAVAAPAGAPHGVIAKLSAELSRYLKLPETQKRFQAEGVEAEVRAPADVDKFVPAEIAKWKGVAKAVSVRKE